MLEKYETKVINGEYLISQNILIDAHQKSIIIGTEYLIKLYHKSKTITILSISDWKRLEYYEQFKEIFSQGGLIPFINYSIRLGFMENHLDSEKHLLEMIECFNKVEDFEKSNYLHNEFIKLKEYVKNNEICI